MLLWHDEGLLFKLLEMQVCHQMVSIINSFLKDKLFCIQIGDSKSTPRHIKARVWDSVSPTNCSLFTSMTCRQYQELKKPYPRTHLFFTQLANIIPAQSKSCNHKLILQLSGSTSGLLLSIHLRLQK